MMLMQSLESLIAVAKKCITLFFARVMQDDAIIS
jgi:hypothetical protein